MGKLDKIVELCSTLNEDKGTIEIHDNSYNKKDVINFARKFNHRVITLNDALEVISNYDLFQELVRLFVDKDDKYNY